MSDIVKNVKIAAPIEKVWAALTDPAAIGGWMGDENTIWDTYWLEPMQEWLESDA